MEDLLQERRKLSHLKSPTVVLACQLYTIKTDNSIIDNSVLSEVLEIFFFSLKPRKCDYAVGSSCIVELCPPSTPSVQVALPEESSIEKSDPLLNL